MPTPSQRVQDTFASPFRKFLPLAHAAKKRGIEVIHLNIGQPDFPMPDGLLDDLWDEGKPDYVPYGLAAGADDLRKEWIRYYRKFRVELNFEELIVTTGASKASNFFHRIVSVSNHGRRIHQKF